MHAFPPRGRITVPTLADMKRYDHCQLRVQSTFIEVTSRGHCKHIQQVGSGLQRPKPSIPVIQSGENSRLGLTEGSNSNCDWSTAGNRSSRESSLARRHSLPSAHTLVFPFSSTHIIGDGGGLMRQRLWLCMLPPTPETLLQKMT